MFDEGILRHVPVVSSVLNWFSPPPKLPEVSGRKFSLQSGKVERTEFARPAQPLTEEGVEDADAAASDAQDEPPAPPAV